MCRPPRRPRSGGIPRQRSLDNQVEGSQTEGHPVTYDPSHTNVALEGRHPHEGSTLTEEDTPTPKKKPRIGPAEAMQQVVKRRGRMLEYERCGLSWFAAQTDEILKRGVCLGHNTYGVTP